MPATGCGLDLGKPRMSDQVDPGLLLVTTRKTSADRTENADWTVLMKSTERNLSVVGKVPVDRYGVVETVAAGRMRWSAPSRPLFGLVGGQGRRAYASLDTVKVTGVQPQVSQ